MLSNRVVRGNLIQAFGLCVALALSGCAFNLADVVYSPAQFQPMGQASRVFVLATNVKLTDMPCWYGRELRQNTRWEATGSVAQGEVFRSRDQILTLECSNIYEAYLVVREGRLVGFFLPVQSGFVVVSEPVVLPVQ